MSAEDGPRDDSSSARSDRDDTTSQSNGGEGATRIHGVDLRRDRTTLEVVESKSGYDLIDRFGTKTLPL